MAPVEAGTKAPAPDLGGRRGPLSPGPVTPAGNQLAMGGGEVMGRGSLGDPWAFLGHPFGVSLDLVRGVSGVSLEEGGGQDSR